MEFIESARYGNISKMKKLLLKGADINITRDGESALTNAVKYSNTKVGGFC